MVTLGTVAPAGRTAVRADTRVICSGPNENGIQ